MTSGTARISLRLVRHPKGLGIPFTDEPCVNERRRDTEGLLWVGLQIDCPECKGTGYVEVPETDSGVSACFADCNRGLTCIWVPDLADSATTGALLQIYRDLSRDPKAYVMFSNLVSSWIVVAKGYDPVESYMSDGAAVAIAILLFLGGRNEGGV